MVEQIDEVATRNAAPKFRSLAAVHTAYFYHLRFESDGTYEVTAYEYFDIDRPLEKVENVAAHLIENALDPNGRDPRPYGTDFDALFRRRKGYFIVALEGAEFASNDPITFKCDGATYTSSKGSQGRHTFKPLGTFQLSTSTGGAFSVTAYLNIARSLKKGVELDHGEWEHYAIELAIKAGASAVERLFDDSGGTNMGPPPPPPGRKVRDLG